MTEHDISIGEENDSSVVSSSSNSSGAHEIIPSKIGNSIHNKCNEPHSSNKTVEINEIKQGEADASFTNISINKISSIQRNHAKYGSMSNVNKVPLLGAKVGLSQLIQPAK